jgi:crossover junction endodeoxyribonuclease RusA
MARRMTEIVRFATQLTLPWPPTVNTYFRPVKIRGGGYMMARTPRARKYCDDAGGAIAQQLGRAPLAPYIRPVRVDIELRAPDRRIRDLDNHIKGLFDALTKAGVWRDDSLVEEFTCRRGQQASGGAAVLLIAALDAGAEPEQIPDDTESDIPPQPAKRRR